MRCVNGEGRVAAYPGCDVVVSAEMEARIVKMLIQEKDHVKKGQLLAELSSDEYAAAVAEAQAHQAESAEEVTYLSLDRERIERLWKVRSASKELLDRTLRDLSMATARRDMWGASARRNAAILAKTRIVAPIDGVVVSRDADAGEMVLREGTICRIVDLSRVRVEAEIDEFDALRVPVGAQVRVTAAGNPGRDWPATVEEVPDAISQRKLKPQDPARPTDANILLAKIRFDGTTPLKLGQRVELEVQLSAEVTGERAAR
jgi:RND family efflux transporter MFP subunit